jgi:hypothetical protein
MYGQVLDDAGDQFGGGIWAGDDGSNAAWEAVNFNQPAETGSPR